MAWVWYVIAGVTIVVVAGTVYYITTKDEEAALKTEEQVEEPKKLTLLSLSDEAIQLKLADKGLTLDADGGVEYFEVEENASTGYQWILKTSDCSPEVVKIETGFDAPVSDKEYDLVGAPGTRYFTFTGKGEGKCNFSMAYARPWEFDWEDEST
mmetsp:Transcript_9741/g.12001  ORF Transcript_9741/g.12001 Transcript_9741/m.12001 type:complete len:154 (-) Transcript_9741:130-591(-)|eukprot:CAMPEP_0170468098 /NCGR_PEP_ID=MMETSP0123-20130129/11408_1 /TAXON_ID=182087 /ORGANISM="Favella ehrenbergii, Strain Fehren 1" /LENGTH=153 /DNA_ID=CAMNT_0010734587 /DNA_START=28 /DNA_END=489 /DNA_ORIENTATION=+